MRADAELELGGARERVEVAPLIRLRSCWTATRAATGARTVPHAPWPSALSRARRSARSTRAFRILSDSSGEPSAVSSAAFSDALAANEPKSEEARSWRVSRISSSMCPRFSRSRTWATQTPSASAVISSNLSSTAVSGPSARRRTRRPTGSSRCWRR